jgi:hypothetical protein
MPCSVTQQGSILRILFSGTLTSQDLERGAERVAEIEDSCAVIPHRTADLRPVERLEIDFEGVLALANARRRRPFQNRFKSAIIAPDMPHYGFARMYQTLNDHPQMCIAIFENDARAVEWLNLAGVSPPEKLWQPERSWILK